MTISSIVDSPIGSPVAKVLGGTIVSPSFSNTFFVPDSTYRFAESNSRGPSNKYSVTGSKDSLIVYFPVKIAGKKLDLTFGWGGWVQKNNYPTFTEEALGNSMLIVSHTLVNEANGQYAEVKYGGSRSCVVNNDTTNVWATPILPSQLGLSEFDTSNNLWHKYEIRLPLLGYFYTSLGRAASSFASTVQMRVFNSAVTTLTKPSGKAYATDGPGPFTWTGTTPDANFSAPTPICLGRNADANNLSIMVTGTSIDDGAWDGVVSTSRRASDFGAGMHNMAYQDYNNSGNGLHWALYNHAQSSSTLSGVVGTNSTRWKTRVIYNDIFVDGGGCNDLQGAVRTVAQIQADKLALWATVKALNPSIKIVCMELLPRTNAANSTLLSGYNTTDVDTLNTWLWAQKAAGNIDEVVSLEALRDTTNRLYWRTISGSAVTDDGIHPNTVGHALAAAALRIAIHNVLGKVSGFYDPADIYNMVPQALTNGTQVSTLKNKAIGASGSDMVQATSGRQPVYNRSGIGDSRGALDCLTTDKDMACSTALSAAELDAIFTIKPTGAGLHRNIATGALVSGSPNITLHSTNVVVISKQGGSTTYGTTAIADDTNYTIDVKAGAGILRTKINGVNDINSTTNPSFTAGVNMLMGRGGTAGFRGQFGLALFLQNVTDSERDSLRANMRTLAGF